MHPGVQPGVQVSRVPNGELLLESGALEDDADVFAVGAPCCRPGALLCPGYGSGGCHAWYMSAARCLAPPVTSSAFAGFRFPPEVITLAVRWYLPAPRGVSSYLQRSWEELEGRFLGPMAYLDAKARGNSSLPEKQRSCSGV